MLTIFNKPMDLLPGSCAVLHDLSWQDYENFLAVNFHRHYRANYYQNTLFIVVPLPEHERPNRLIADLVKELLDYQGRDWDDFGSTTFRKQAKNAGVEPDSSFYIENYNLVSQCRRINLEEFPPPDLVIESDVTSLTKLDTYKALEVPEVWIYQGDKLQIYLYSKNNYLESETSGQFPNVDVKSLIEKLVPKIFTGVPSSQIRKQFRQQL
ncbi:MAG TPA: hypothetical protein DCF68_08575 [Cyanothece sp. UBA12306]|nr:hypothetical protein [Cyanothece sp. UBA12306]